MTRSRFDLIESDLACAEQHTVDSPWYQEMTRSPDIPERLSYPTETYTLRIPKRMLALLALRADEQNTTIPELLRLAVVAQQNLTTDQLPPQIAPTAAELRSARLNATCSVR